MRIPKPSLAMIAVAAIAVLFVMWGESSSREINLRSCIKHALIASEPGGGDADERLETVRDDLQQCAAE